MQRLWISTLTAALLMVGVSAAKADTFSVFADLPVQSSIKFQDSSVSSEGVSGFKAGVTFPIFLGLALEDYTITLSKKNGDYKVSLFDVFFNLPLPVINLAAGIGAGTGAFQDEGVKQAYQDAPLTQFWVSVGIPIATLFDVHIGYHSFKGRHPGRSVDLGGGVTLKNNDLNVEGTMTSIGAKVGF